MRLPARAAIAFLVSGVAGPKCTRSSKKCNHPVGESPIPLPLTYEAPAELITGPVKAPDELLIVLESIASDK